MRIVQAAPRHRAGWGRLFAGYAAFYGVAQTEAMRETVWGWILDPSQEVKALLAEAQDGEPVGLAHYRAFARPLRASRGLFLDDLFVDPAWRGQGVADALLAALAERAAAEGCDVVRWITAEDNLRARAVYDRVAQATRWVTYDMPPAR
ncbi:MAG: GNAT family N-acetyltransferase [Acetobacteraceae bacterium]|nr:GNAT family N-acetyltransferase [Acetobacteraceae bacterium]